MKTLLIIGAITSSLACGVATGDSAQNKAAMNTAIAPEADNSVADKDSGMAPMHSAPELLKIIEKDAASVNSILGGKEIIVIGELSYQTDGQNVILTAGYQRNIWCSLSIDSIGDESVKLKALAKDLLNERLTKTPIVELRGVFTEGANDKKNKSVSASMEKCKIINVNY